MSWTVPRRPYLCQQRLQLDMFSLCREQDLLLGWYLRCPGDPVLECIDGTEGHGISVETLARMSYSYLQGHSSLARQLVGVLSRQFQKGSRGLEC